MTHRPIQDIENDLRAAQVEHLMCQGGRSTADALLSAVVRLSDELKAAYKYHADLEHHLRYNHFPPIDLGMIQPCADAVSAVSEGDYDRPIVLPEHITWKGCTSVPASIVVSQHHLEDWVDDDGT